MLGVLWPQGPPAHQTKEPARGLWPLAGSFRALRALPPPPFAAGIFTVLPEGAAETRLQAVGRHPRLGTMRTQ